MNNLGFSHFWERVWLGCMLIAASHFVALENAVAQVIIRPLGYPQKAWGRWQPALPILSPNRPSMGYGLSPNLRPASPNQIIVPTNRRGIFEDWSQVRNSRPDTLLWESFGGVTINNSFGVRPPSVNVATFDGMRYNGRPYSDTLSLKGFCDTLQTKPLDLTLYRPGRDSWFVRFRYQPGSSVPQTIADTNSYMALELSSDATGGIWKRIWTQKGTDSIEVDSFTTAKVPIVDSLVAGDVRLRWMNYGQKNGWYDSWNLDYIQLAVNLDNLDTLSDITWTTPITRVFSKYSALPRAQFGAMPPRFLRDSIQAVIRNNRPERGLPVTFVPEVRFYQWPQNSLITDVPAADINGSFFAPPLNTKERTVSVRKTSYQSLAGLAISDTTEAVYSRFTLRAQGSINTIRSNDTILSVLPIGDVMSCDDGTAEGILFVQGPGAKGVIELETFVKDTLTAVQMYIPFIRPIPNVVTQVPFRLKVLTFLGDGNPSSPTRLDSSLLSSSQVLNYNSSIDSFVTYVLPRPVIVRPGKFFIGFEQVANVENEVRLGFDINYPDSTPFWYNRDGRWQKFTRVGGVPMIRAVFGRSSAPTSVKNPSLASAAKLYPNPIHSHTQELQLDGLGLSSAQLLDSQGKLLWTWVLDAASENHSLDLPVGLSAGMYLVRVTDTESLPSTLRLLVH